MVRRSPYAELLALPGVLRLYLIAFVARLPYAMTGVVLTLHVVTTLHRGYAQAGLVSAVSTIGMAVGGPWRGRLVDRLGLRRAVAPSVAVTCVVWFVAPHLPYQALLAAAFVAGVYQVPAFPVTRQSLSVMVPARQQRTAFALDSVCVELTFMVAPVVGVAIATSVSTTAALTVVAVAAAGGGALLLWANPPTRSDAAPVPAGQASGSLVSPTLLVVLFALVAASFVLVGTDVSLVAVLNEAGRPQDVGWMVALWCLGSVGGGLVYGSRGGSASPLVLVALLALATLPVAFLTQQPWLAVAIVVSGIPCAPTLASVNAALVRLVPEHRRGEVMGWSGTAQTVGNALGAPLVGWVIDRVSPGAGFLTAACAGGAAAVVGLVVLRVARARRGDGVRDAAPGPDSAGGDGATIARPDGVAVTAPDEGAGAPPDEQPPVRADEHSPVFPDGRPSVLPDGQSRARADERPQTLADERPPALVDGQPQALPDEQPQTPADERPPVPDAGRPVVPHRAGGAVPRQAAGDAPDEAAAASDQAVPTGPSGRDDRAVVRGSTRGEPPAGA